MIGKYFTIDRNEVKGIPALSLSDNLEEATEQACSAINGVVICRNTISNWVIVGDGSRRIVVSEG